MHANSALLWLILWLAYLVWSSSIITMLNIHVRHTRMHIISQYSYVIPHVFAVLCSTPAYMYHADAHKQSYLPELRNYNLPTCARTVQKSPSKIKRYQHTRAVQCNVHALHACMAHATSYEIISSIKAHAQLAADLHCLLASISKLACQLHIFWWQIAKQTDWAQVQPSHFILALFQDPIK